MEQNHKLALAKGKELEDGGKFICLINWETDLLNCYSSRFVVFGAHSIAIYASTKKRSIRKEH